MTDIWKCLAENIKEATNILKRNGSIVEFNDEANIPYVLINESCGMIADVEVSKVRLDEHDKMEIYIPEWESWLGLEDCLSATANNICMSINHEFNK